MVILDAQKEIIFYCDSLGAHDQSILNKVCSHIRLEIKCSGKASIDMSNWKVYYYCESPHFPIQNDQTSCGPYICMMAKATLFKKLFIFDKSKVRQSMMHELDSGVVVL